MLSLNDVREVFYSCSCSLQQLSFWGCTNLRSVREGLEHLTVLEYLKFGNCVNLILSGEDDIHNNMMPFYHSLNYLRFQWLPQLADLPDWMRFLTSLQTLEVDSCGKLKSIPNWISRLTSLGRLFIYGGANGLKERCQYSTGEDWPHIQHIPSIEIRP